MNEKPSPTTPALAPWLGTAVLTLAAIAGVVLALRTCSRITEPASSPEAPPVGSAAPDDSGAPAAQAAPRCAPAAKGKGFLVGEAPKVAPLAKDPKAGDAEPDEPDLSPFAVELGRGAVTSTGYVLGALRDAEGGSVANIVTLRDDGEGGTIVKLARSRGDMDAPIVVAKDDVILAGMMEPNAGGRALKIARVDGETVHWGLELAEGRDESLAFDLGLGSVGVAVWDDVTTPKRRSVVMLAAFEPKTFATVRRASPVSEPKLDADTPRIMRRPGGFWLIYVAHDEPKEGFRKQGEELDEEGAGEIVPHAWLEVMPLDDSAGPAGIPRSVTPKDGYVLAYDVETTSDGALLLAYRDDDTPTGSSGGQVSITRVTLGKVDEAVPVAMDSVGGGIPDLLPGWIAMSDIRGPKRLAPMSETGELLGLLVAEPSVGLAEPVAAKGENLLVARPEGRSIRLEVVRCLPGSPQP